VSNGSNGFIKLDRKILQWEWYQESNTFRVFTHCLLKANFQEKRWQGQIIKRGSFITSISNLSKETGLTFQQVRTALNKLQATGEITSKATNRNTQLTINNYDKYQSDNKPDNKRITNKEQTDNKQITTTNKVKKDKKDKKDKNIYGIFENILLSDEEYQKLLKIYIYEDVLEIAFEKLSVWKSNKKKKATHNYGCLLKSQWVYKQLVEDGVIKTNQPRKLTLREQQIQEVLLDD